MKMIGRTNKKERGVALLLAIMALLLITAAGLAMLFSSDAETDISVNYRDKQVAIYAAMAGLQEARDRIHPKTGDLAEAGKVPTVLPAASSTPNSVLYVINPSDGETVAPWDPSNKYFDTELCHEGILGMTAPASPSLPCDPANSAQVPPSGAGWRIVIDNSSGSTVWNKGSLPLSYKWVRITLKADNMTPVTVGKMANGTQVCWAGSHEQQMTEGYTAACGPKRDKVTNISVTNPGSGYTTPPTVTISGGGGSGAAADADVAQMTEGVTSAHLTNGGSGYTSVPNVVVNPVDGNGAGAQVTAQLGSPVRNVVSLSTTGTPPCYGTYSPTMQLSFDSTYGSGASGSVKMLTGQKCVYSFGASGSCKHNTAHPVTVTASGGFSGTFDLNTGSGDPNNYAVQTGSAKVTNPGVGTPTTFALPSTCTITVTPVYGYQIDTSSSSTTVTNGGLYTQAPAVSVVGGVAASGSGTITGTTMLEGGSTANQISALTVTASGGGYTANPTLIIGPPSGGGTQATGWASIAPDSGVSGIRVTNRGDGYTSAPTVTLSPPTVAGGVQATAIATLGSGGASYGAVYLLTSMAQTKTGARAMVQMEVGQTFDNFTMSLGGALTVAGPSPTFGTPNSEQFKMIGTDCPTCGPQPSTCNGKTFPAKPSIGAYDDPNNPTTPSSVQSITNALGKPNNYIGVHSSPDIENAFSALGTPTPDGMNAFVQSVAAVATNTYTSDPGTKLNFGTAANPVIDYIDGDLTLSGNTTGYGILVVTGTLKLNGDYHWNGLILVIGNGASVMSGGGNGQVNGAVFIANTNGGTSLGSPNVAWAGGGGNGIQYNHCWADDMLAKVPFTPPLSPNPLQIISVRVLDM